MKKMTKEIDSTTDESKKNKYDLQQSTILRSVHNELLKFEILGDIMILNNSSTQNYIEILRYSQVQDGQIDLWSTRQSVME